VDGVHAENLVGDHDNQRIDRREPRGRSGFSRERIAETFPGRDRARDASGFIFKWCLRQRDIGNLVRLVDREAEPRNERNGKDQDQRRRHRSQSCAHRDTPQSRDIP
jgi:hypothetical protein